MRPITQGGRWESQSLAAPERPCRRIAETLHSNLQAAMPAAPRRKSSLLKHLNAADNPIYAVDSEGKLIFVNSATAAWLGIAAGDLIGQVCRYSSSVGGPPASIAAGFLAPPPAAMAGLVCTAEVFPPPLAAPPKPTSAPPPGQSPAVGDGQAMPTDRPPIDQPPADAPSADAHESEEPAAPPGLMFRYIPLGVVEGKTSLVLAQSLGPVGMGGGDTSQQGTVGDSSATFAEQPQVRIRPVDPLPQELHAQLQRMRRRNLRAGHRQRFSGVSAAITRVRAQIAIAAQGRTHVLVTGVAGSGRADAAWAIHAASHDADEPLVGVHCGDLPSDLALAEIEHCWYSGPGAPRTLLLNDVDLLSLEAQQQLHRMLVERPPALRIVSTARRPLGAGQAQGSFHHELALLLSTIVIELPPLASRLEDLPLLAQALLEDANANSAKQIGGFTDDALRLLISYPWPKDVDELVSAIWHAHEQAQSPLIGPSNLPEIVQMASDFAKYPQRAEETIDLEGLLQEVEVECIRWAMEKARGNKTQAARLLGMNRPKFYRRLEQLNMDDGDSE